MDSLIYYSNSYLETVNDEVNSELMTMLPPDQLLLGFKDESFSNSIQDTSFFEPPCYSNELFLPQVNSYQQQQQQQQQPSIIPLVGSGNSYQQLNNFQSCPKRQKFFQNNCCLEITNNYFNEFVPNPPMLQDLTSFSLPEFPSLPVYRNENALEAKVSSVKKCNEKNLSAQSIAARQRRKKITEKTQELGKLIPGGQKMNTAEMFQAAYKYINFLQAQVGILQFMGSYEEKGEPFQTPQIHKLVGSPLIQEKLYSSDKCLVPEMFLEALANDLEFQHSNPRVLKEVNQLIKPGS